MFHEVLLPFVFILEKAPGQVNAPPPEEPEVSRAARSFSLIRLLRWTGLSFLMAM